MGDKNKNPAAVALGSLGGSAGMTKFELLFWSKVSKTDTCWNWIGCRNTAGYGSVSREGRIHSAHRISFEMAFGLIPAGLNVLHDCDNPSCVRPDHLVAGTQSQNLKDAVARGRCKPSTPFTSEAAKLLGAAGGKAGTGDAKRRSPEHYARISSMGQAAKKRRQEMTKLNRKRALTKRIAGSSHQKRVAKRAATRNGARGMKAGVWNKRGVRPAKRQRQKELI